MQSELKDDLFIGKSFTCDFYPLYEGLFEMVFLIYAFLGCSMGVGFLIGWVCYDYYKECLQ